MNQKIDFNAFYGEYHGHRNEHLGVVWEHLMSKKEKGEFDGIVYLAGDSSLDNKWWFRNTAPALNGYEDIISNGRSIMDITYWLNKLELESAADGRKYGVINCAVEESTVGARACSRLLDQDAFIKEHITGDDILVVSVGGNDIALKPNPCTIVNMLTLVKCVPYCCIEQACGTAIPVNDCCCGCGPACLSNLTAFPLGIGYFIHLFKVRIQKYIENVIGTSFTGSSEAKARRVLVCMIYYPDEVADGSWADMTLSSLDYNKKPEKLQLVIRKIFTLATQAISLPGVEVIGVPLFVPLDGKDTTSYSQRVEPSASGGEKMAQLIHMAAHSVSAGDEMRRAFVEHETKLLGKEPHSASPLVGGSDYATMDR
eukprot:GSChrysophyteH1.ASY1.ANO1.3283.1 assembled CDS